jgi:hypothetical protein
MNSFAAAGLGCMAALALWKGTKERWFPSLLGMIVIAATVKYAESNTDLSWLIFIFGYAVFTTGAYGLKWYDKRKTPKREPPEQGLLLWCGSGYQRGGHFIGPNEPYRFLDEEGGLKGRPDM